MKPPTNAGRFRYCWRTLSPLAICAVVILFVFSVSYALHAQSEAKRITVYTAQTSYSVPVVERNTTDYVGLLELLGPMGPISARLDGKKWKFRFRNVEGQFEIDRSKVSVKSKSLNMPGPLLMENGHGLVPVSSVRELLRLFSISPADYHEPSRRLFIGANIVRVAAKRIDTGKVTLAFSAPVNPSISTETGRLHMVFDREPLQSDSRSLGFDDKLIPFATYFESNGSAELTVISPAPLTATFSEDRKVITITAVVQQQQPTPAPTATSTPSSNGSGASNISHPASPPEMVAPPKPRIFVIIDAAHGGSDRGAAAGAKIWEKDVTLGVANRLRHELEARGVDVVLVRDSDTTLSLDQRISIVNSSDAALYLGLHATPFGVGMRVYSSTVTPESRSNLTFVPVQMAQAARVNESKNFATAIAQSLAARDLKASVLPGSLPLLNSISIPAVMVEMSPREIGADELGNGAFQQFVANALATALAGMQSQRPREASR